MVVMGIRLPTLPLRLLGDPIHRRARDASLLNLGLVSVDSRLVLTSFNAIMML